MRVQNVQPGGMRDSLRDQASCTYLVIVDIL